MARTAEGENERMPKRLTIGTQKAFENDEPFSYVKEQIGSETIYVCTKGSKWAHGNDVLVLRCENGTWTAFDSAISANGSTLYCLRPVFRCLTSDVTQQGWHLWQTNCATSPMNIGYDVDWRGPLLAETRWP